MRIKDLKEGHEELNLPIDACMDTPVYRDAYKDLIKHKSTKNVSYWKFLSRMRERNFASRKREFERRKIEVTSKNAPTFYKAFKEIFSAHGALITAV